MIFSNDCNQIMNTINIQMEDMINGIGLYDND